MTLIPDLINHAEKEQADRSVINFGGREILWREFAQIVNRLANAFVAAGCGRGSSLAILAHNCPEYIYVVAAALKAGACVVPLSTLGAESGLETVLLDAQPTIVAASRDFAAKLSTTLDKAELSDIVRIGLDFSDLHWPTLESFSAGHSPTAPTQAIQPSDSFNIIYSSGTTGVPKGIIQDHQFRAWQSEIICDALEIRSISSVLVAMPLYSNASFGGILPFLMRGGRIILRNRFSEEEFLRDCETLKPSHVFMVPTMLQRLLAWPTFQQFDLGRDTWKWVGTAPFSEEYKRKVLSQWPGPFVETYGMSEGGPIFALFAHNYPDKLNSVGLPMGDTEVLILDENDAPVSCGQTGEILGRSSGMMRGYHNQPERTEELIYRDHIGRSFFRTGDLGHLDPEGFLYLSGRKKDMIISGGFNVYPIDIERVLSAHPEVSDAAVVGIPNTKWGEQPVAFVVPKAGFNPSEQDILDWVNSRVGKPQRLAAIQFESDLPRSTVGKVLKRELQIDSRRAVFR